MFGRILPSSVGDPAWQQMLTPLVLLTGGREPHQFAILAYYTSKTYNASMFSFIETKLFSRLVGEHLSDDEYVELQKVLITDPEAGALIPGSGGVRKIRWGATGRGKRGGLRIIYYAKTYQGVIWMLTLYPKNVTENIPAHVLKKIKEEIDG